MQLTATIALSMLPLLVFGGAAVLRPAPDMVPKLVQTEGVTARRMDADSFRHRWPTDLPPMAVVHEVPAAVATAATVPLPPARIMRRAALRQDNVCTRHNMRKQYYTGRGGWQRWRCRR